MSLSKLYTPPFCGRLGVGALRKQSRVSFACQQYHIRWLSVSLGPAEVKKLTVTLKDGRQTHFDHQYLLDHCRCPQCFHSGTKQRLKTLMDFPRDVKPISTATVDGGLSIEWSNQHRSFYPAEVLERSSYDPPLHAPHDDTRTPWTSDISSSPPSVEYASIMSKQDESGAGVLQLLDEIHKQGICFIYGVPPTPEATEEVIRRIANIRETHYGGFWDFTADMSHGDLAYSTQALPAHTDTTYFTDPAGLQIFHQLHHDGTGGMSLLVDGFYAASQLSVKAYHTLARLGVPSHASGNKSHLLRPANHAALRHDQSGELVQVRWNNEDRGVLGFGWSPEDVPNWYEAAREFEEIIRSSKAEYWVQLRPGAMIVIDNWRVMHGRASFTGSRRMCGAYVGADDWRARRNALREGVRAHAEDTWRFGW